MLTGIRLSMSVVGLIVVLFVVLCSGFRSPLSPLHCFMTRDLIICILLWGFTNVAEDRCADRTYICNRAASELKVMFRVSKTGLSLAPFFFYMTVARRFLCCRFSLHVCDFICGAFFVIIYSSSLFWRLWKAVIRDCGISWVSSLTFPRNSISL